MLLPCHRRGEIKFTTAQQFLNYHTTMFLPPLIWKKHILINIKSESREQRRNEIAERKGDGRRGKPEIKLIFTFVMAAAVSLAFHRHSKLANVMLPDTKPDKITTGKKIQSARAAVGRKLVEII